MSDNVGDDWRLKVPTSQASSQALGQCDAHTDSFKVRVLGRLELLLGSLGAS